MIGHFLTEHLEGVERGFTKFCTVVGQGLVRRMVAKLLRLRLALMWAFIASLIKGILRVPMCVVRFLGALVSWELYLVSTMFQGSHCCVAS